MHVLRCGLLERRRRSERVRSLRPGHVQGCRRRRVPGMRTGHVRRSGRQFLLLSGRRRLVRGTVRKYRRASRNDSQWDSAASKNDSQWNSATLGTWARPAPRSRRRARPASTRARARVPAWTARLASTQAHQAVLLARSPWPAPSSASRARRRKPGAPPAPTRARVPPLVLNAIRRPTRLMPDRRSAPSWTLDFTCLRRARRPRPNVWPGRTRASARQ